MTHHQHDGDQERDEAPEPETRPGEEEGAETTPMGQTDVEQDERGTTAPGEG